MFFLCKKNHFFMLTYCDNDATFTIYQFRFVILCIFFSAIYSGGLDNNKFSFHFAMQFFCALCKWELNCLCLFHFTFSLFQPFFVLFIYFWKSGFGCNNMNTNRCIYFSFIYIFVFTFFSMRISKIVSLFVLV